MATAKRVICVGHAALDRIYRISTFPPEPTKVRALEGIEVGGGMAANAAVAAARLGATVELWSRTGDDGAGAMIRAGLKAEKVDVRYVRAFEDARSSTSAIIVDGRGERMIVGLRDTAIPSSTSWLPLERVAEVDVVLADLRWLEATRSVLEAARRAGVTSVLDADLGAREAVPGLLALADYAVFSAPALRELLPDHPDDRGRLAALSTAGPRHVGVTLGPGGYLWWDRDGGGSQPGFAVPVVDTTGAGDAFHGAFAALLAEGLPAAQCARLACAVAAMKCTRLGGRAGLPRRAELEKFLATAGND